MTSTTDRLAPRSHRTMSTGRWIGAVLLLLVVGFGICESLGWPFLASPMQRWLGKTLQRKVSFNADPAADPTVHIHLLGGIRLEAPYIEIGAPAWSQAPHMLLAKDARMTLGYGDLWRASRGEPLRIRELRAASLDGQVERLADGRASWQFGKKSQAPDTAEQPTRLPVFGKLQVEAGTLGYRDALIDADLDATFSVTDGTNISSGGLQKGGSASGLVFQGKGHYQKQPVQVDLLSNGVLSVVSGDTSVALPIKLGATIGGAAFDFNGTATDVLRLEALQGRFTIKGSSLAAVGDPLHVTLPSTPPFSTTGLLKKDGKVWNVVFDSAAIGSSRLAGAFRYDTEQAKPLLSGQLTGSKLLLADLGPSVGASTGKGTTAPPETKERSGKVLPDRAFDLPSLRAMNANVVIDIADFDLGSTILAPFEPLRTHLVLQDGVLTLQNIMARTGQGQLLGSLRLDGRQPQARWEADLNLAGVRLETWIHQKRGSGTPPYITGRLNAQTRLAGEGKSTAAILGSLRGDMRLHVTDGTISHLAMEAAGLDLAQGLGMLVKGDDALPLSCSVADIDITKGVMTPRLMVIDNRDSTIWVDGSISLANEALDLRAVTDPKDFSPLSFRTPVLLKGTLGDPHVSIESKAKLGGKVGIAALLAAVINPVAAVIPLLDFGDKDDAKKGAAACQALVARMARQPLPAASATHGGKPA